MAEEAEVDKIDTITEVVSESPKAHGGAALGAHSVAEVGTSSVNQILEWQVVGNHGLPTEDTAGLPAQAEDILTIRSASPLQGEQITEESDAPFILVSHRRSGRKATLSH